MKRLLLTAVLAVLLFALPFSAAADSMQHITLSEFDGALMLSAQAAPTDWELVCLQAGESPTDSGVLVLENTTAAPRSITLSHIELPFNDAAAIAYLQNVTLTVRDGDTVLYSGPYTRANDENGLKFSYDLEPAQKVTLMVDVACAYTVDNAQIPAEGVLADWKFYTVVKTPVQDDEKVSSALTDPALREALVAVAAAAALLLGVGAYEIIKRRR